MKKVVYAVAVAALALPSAALAQTGSVNAVATVPYAVTVTVQDSLRFGAVNAGSPATVTPTAPEAARFEVVYNAETQVTITLPATLDHESVAATLTPTFTCGYTNASDDVGTITLLGACSSGSTMDLPFGTAQATSHVRVGGAITVPADAAAGTYRGQISIAAARIGT